MTEDQYSELKNKFEELLSLKGANITENTQILGEYTNILKGDLKDLVRDFERAHSQKSIRLLKNVNAYRSILYQEVYKDAIGKISSYGDIFISGGDINRSGSGRGLIPSGFSRLPIPLGVEIEDVIGGHGSFYAKEKDSSSMWVWGNNSQGCLGLGHNLVVPIPKEVSFGFKIKKIVSKSYSASFQFVLVLLEDGSVWGAGRNTEGQLGIGNTIDSNRFVQISTISNIVNIWAGSNFVSGAFALDNTGKLYAWGWNGNGCLGLGHNSTPVLKPTLVSGLEDVTEVYHYTKDDSGWRGNTFVQKGKKEIYGCGYNGQRQLNQDDLNDRSAFTKVIGLGAEIAKFIGGTCYNTCFIVSTDGYVVAWGHGNYGFGDNRSGNNLKNGDSPISIKNIETQPYNYQAFFAQDFYNFFYSFGYNNNALGLGHNNNVRTFERMQIPQNIEDFMLASVWESERAFIATDGKRLYACGTAYDGNINYTTSVAQPQLIAQL
ncbi:hypothetical protein BKH41_02855 [Helicobacter sp. 12S02232-10]|uniref:RCC1 domain-containing protein n=1 Tax=Helicobacter sp. 12S02232-10 TaxID=1476197 RepID=UPI000BA6AAC2|nr:RCC1 domain-containing protein [Helicobacter sp. 12S02232-10]PAF49620.1 hypothetical protein BKH41_02855 [Helicobacter sp. 12S02232-10]